MGGVTAGEFRVLLERLLRKAEAVDRDRIELRAGDLHRDLGGYPGPGHRMPMCCEVIRPGDRIVQQPPKGNGAPLTINHELPGERGVGNVPEPV